MVRVKVEGKKEMGVVLGIYKDNLLVKFPSRTRPCIVVLADAEYEEWKGNLK